MNIKNNIIDYANKIGVPYIGFTDTTFSKKFINNLKNRRNENKLSGFEEEDELKRVDIESLLNGAKTIVSIALPYKYKDQNYIEPYFSKYTMGEDYHRILTSKLNLIKSYIEDNFNEKCIFFCDTGVVSDKEIARKSGLGFVGKNTNIITKNHGSYVFLGEIITTLEIEPCNAKESLCGSCDKCIKACPAKAIDETGIDGKRCLSYITQKKDDLTLEEMERLGNRIFGCDTCQDVCPHNKEVSTSNIDEFKPLEHSMNINLEELLFMSNKEFKIKYGRQALAWRGKFIVQRNAIIAAGNSRNKKYIEVLKKKKDDIRLQNYIDIAIEKINQC
ncbi:tRNA epoxyqueuosine(34) reductase QueG [Clostridium cylindrosporum]|uniref:Epoxyqueuosine reductase QueG n=1 Tax=Clostridium cylindrosporum DSM 605 TaxID=1121307 RepID=A0A0J8D966_CLOCY|nr:tRNA epoxyqueuosine(34) reductase QueG [Clostridium cylindrosporum]KMT20823.1 epoxyqueuosine reductase QueG [Clostridium cylindrosporum DSM 605]